MSALGKLARLRTEWWLMLLASAVLMGALVHAGGAARLDYLAYDLLLRTSTPADADWHGRDDIVIVAIDNRSLAEIGAWPWARDVQARLLEQVSRGTPRAVALDVLLSDARDPAADEPLARAITAGNVFLPLAFDVPGKNGAAFAAEPPLPLFVSTFPLTMTG